MRFIERRSIGRDDELTVLDRCLARTQAGLGSLILLIGDPGIGKTTLLSDFTATAGTEANLLRGTSHGAEGTPPFWPWTQALRRAIAGADPDTLTRLTTGTSVSLAPVLPELAGYGLSEDAVTSPEFAQLRFFDSMTQFLSNVGHERPLVVMFEDLHWADVPTLLLLAHVAREIEHMPVMVIASYRETELLERHEGNEFAREVARLPSTTTLRLRGITPSETGELIQRIAAIDEPLPETVRTRIAGFSGGNPLFATEVIEHITRGATGSDARTKLSAGLAEHTSITIPDSLREMAENRLVRVSFACRDLLRVAAVLGRDFELSTLVLVGGLPPDETEKLVHEACQARLLEPVRGYRYGFTHSLFREQVVAGTSPEWATEVHLRIARSLRDAPELADEGHEDQLAYHFAEAALAGATVPEALPMLLAAAGRAMETLAYDRAHEQYKRARQVLNAQGVEDPEQEYEIVMASCRAFTAGGHRKRRNAAALEAASLADQLDDGLRFADAALGYQGRGLEAGLVDDQAVALLRKALQVMPAAGAESSRAIAMARLAQELHFSGDDEAVELASESVALAERVADSPTLAQVLRTRHASLRGPGDIAERTRISARIVELADRSGDLQMRISSRLRHVVDLVELGVPDRVGRTADEYSRLAEESGVAYHRWSTTVLESMRHCLYGRLPEADEFARAAFSLGQQHGADLAVPFHLIQRWLTAIHRGEGIALEDDFRRVVDLYPALPAWRSGIAMVYREAGRLDQARGEFENIVGAGIDKLPIDGNWVQLVDYLAQICWSLEDRDRAEDLYDALLPCRGRMVMIGRGVGCCGAVDRSLGLLAALLDRRDVALRHFDDAISLNARMGARPYLAWTRLDLADVLVGWGDPRDLDRVNELIETAVDDARELHLDGVIGRAAVVGKRRDRLTALLAEADAFELSIKDATGVVTVLVTDLVGSTPLQRQLGDQPFFDLLERHNGLVRAALDAHEGVEIKHTGDGIMAGFNSADQAVAAASAIRQAIETHNGSSDSVGDQISLRIGLNAGEAIVDRNDLFGIAVTAACRICDVADEGQVLVSEAVIDLCVDSTPALTSVGEVELKGFDLPVSLYSIT